MILNYRLLLPLILLCTTSAISAEERWFEIELLLFQRNMDIKAVKEDLIIKNSMIDSSSSTRLLKTEVNNLCVEGSPCLHKKIPVLIDNTQFDAQANGFQRLDNEQLQLTPQREKLKKHASFEPLLHLAWRMPVKNRNSAKAIHLFAGENYADKIAQSASDKWAIDGNFKIYLDRYLFIDSQLLVRQETTQDIISAAVKPQEQEFEVLDSENDVQVIKQNENLEPAEVKQKTVINEVLFDQNRRLRSGEIHYFDHPLMGMIVQIRKIPAQELVEMLESTKEQELTEAQQLTE